MQVACREQFILLANSTLNLDIYLSFNTIYKIYYLFLKKFSNRTLSSLIDLLLSYYPKFRKLLLPENY